MSILLPLLFIAVNFHGYQLFSVGSYGFIASNAVILLIYSLFFKKIFWEGKSLVLPNSPIFLFYVLLFVAVLLSSINPLFRGDSVLYIQYSKSFLHLVFLMLVPLVFILMPEKIKTWSNVFKVLLILSIFINIFGLYQIFARAFDLPFAWLELTNVSFANIKNVDMNEDVRQLSLKFSNFYRGTSIFSEPSALATFNLYCFCILMPSYFMESNPLFKSKLLLRLITITTALGLFITFSLTAALGVVLILGSVFLLGFGKNFLKIFKFAALIFVVFAIIDVLLYNFLDASIFGLFQQRIEGLLFARSGAEGMAGESFRDRYANVMQCVDVWSSYPITGYGLGLLRFNDIDNHFAFADTTVMSVLAELGIIGFIAFIGFFASVFYSVFKFSQKYKTIDIDDPEQNLRKYVLLASNLALIPFFTVNFFSSNHFVGEGLWITGLILLGPILYLMKESGDYYELVIVRNGFKERVDKYLLSLKKT